MRWSQLQPLLTSDGAGDLLKLHAAQASLGLIDPQEVAFCGAKLKLPAEQLNPPPLVTGGDLLALGISAGPVFARLLRAVREAQLDAVINDRTQALQLIEKLQRENKE
jgi:hypothetical protein